MDEIKRIVGLASLVGVLLAIGLNVYCGLNEDIPVFRTKRDPSERTTEPHTKPSAADRVVLDISQGRLEGRNRLTAKSVPYASFENIPFAQPPTGKLSFKDPKPAPSWDDVRDATVRGPLCLQVNIFNQKELEIVGDVDCLQLNVYTPDTSPDKLLPVMVYIHGGGFQWSTGLKFNNPELFVEEKVVLVTINYRLGVFGFLSLGTEEVPGNAGLKDQVLALKWIRDNIASFGGDKDSVTVFGESAGGASVTYLQISPMAAGLMHKAIALSGTNLCSWIIQEDPENKVSQLASILALDHSARDLLDQLQNITPLSLFKASLHLKPAEGKIKDLGFMPVLEQAFVGKKTYMSKPAHWHYENKQFSDIPTMIGYVNYEQALQYSRNKEKFYELVNKDLYHIPSSWNLVSNVTLFKEVASRIKNFYFNGRDFAEDSALVIDALNLIGDLVKVISVDDTVRTITKHSKSQTTYYYRFSYSGSSGDPIMKQLGLKGATHIDELYYVFPLAPLAEGSTDDLVSKRLVTLYTNFAKFGNPTPGPASTLLPTTWKPVAPDVVNYLEINEELTSGTDPDGHRALFWRELKAYVDEQNKLTPDD